MSDDLALVTASQIAAMAGVGRAAVANWSRRHEDFPKPAVTNASAPLYSWREVKDWLDTSGRSEKLHASIVKGARRKPRPAATNGDILKALQGIHGELSAIRELLERQAGTPSA